jgi:DNA-binding NarL/FixJ family response regulator
MDVIRVLLVDDHGVVRNGLGKMLELEEDIEVVGEASNAEETLNMVEIVSPSVILMDIKMPGMDGITLTKKIKNKLPSCNVIMFTLHGDYLTQAIEAGASGYLLKDIRRTDLSEAIRQVNDGQVVISENIGPET